MRIEVRAEIHNMKRLVLPCDICKDPEQGYAIEKYVSGIDDNDIKTGYSIKFSKSKAEELHKMCIDESQHPTAYVIQKGHQKMGLHISVDSFHDWCNGNAEELLRVRSYYFTR